ncbi:MAG: zf-HC2 domain-containing protein [bacterium]
MECSKAKELLSEYIDDALNPEQTEEVKNHLSHCERCAHEYNALKAVADSLNSLEPIKAPQDFLDNVHTRIHRRSWLSRVVKKIFVPVKIKIPLECAGVLATAVLVIFIIRGVYKTEQSVRPPHPSVTWEAHEEEKISRTTSDEVKIEPGKKQKTREAKSGLSTKAKKERVELALVLTPPSEVKAQAPKRLKSLRRGIHTEEKQFFGAAQPSLEEDHYEPIDQKGGQIKKEQETRVSNLLDKGIAEIITSLEKVNGESISTEYDVQTGQPHMICADIPSENYHTFLEQLRRIGTVEQPVGLEHYSSSGILKVCITLIQTTM